MLTRLWSAFRRWFARPAPLVRHTPRLSPGVELSLVNGEIWVALRYGDRVVVAKPSPAESRAMAWWLWDAARAAERGSIRQGGRECSH